ncbi:High-affnity carbon uptake protein Hat/HatR [Enhygromyxa salina]|uniref:High-affnity carbon uptake protein Hat/HatR n=1 Tax=Enhygromyxa salina TaxID=215803 RepID=A0A0C2D791_9BACT|nr:High-affnity carbon uptake protein Hat/HatR [Enhygromyxa salina]
MHIRLEFARADDVEDPYAIRMGRQEYVLRGPGGTFGGASLRWNDALLAELAGVARPSPDPEAVQALGGRLREFLEPTGWASREREIQDALEADTPVLLTVRSAAAELYALPFELLTIKATGQHLGELSGLLIRYEWPGTSTTATEVSPAPEGGRILFAWSAAGGEVPVSDHHESIRAGIKAGELPANHLVELRHASLTRIDDALKAASEAGQPITVLHLLCHGAAAGQSIGLALEHHTDDDGTDIVDAGRLRRVLGAHAPTLRSVVLCACKGADPGALGAQLGSVAQVLHRAGVETVLASRFPLSVAGSTIFARVFYAQLLGEPSSVEAAFLAGRRALTAQDASLDWASIQLYARESDGDDHRPIVFRPYRGLLPFRASDRRFFYGRDTECALIRGRVDELLSGQDPRFLAIAGASGSGKSSVVMAGVLPSLVEREDQRWVHTLMRPGGRQSPTEELLAAVCRLIPGVQSSLPELIGSLRTQGPELRVLVLIDQFEEVFASTEASQFVGLLWTLATTPNLPLVVMITMRIDFLGHCSQIALDHAGTRLDTIVYDDNHHIFIGHLQPRALEQAIRRPAERVGLQLDAGLVQALTREVGDEPGALPLLEYALDLLWRSRVDNRMTVDTYNGFGSVEGALTRTADELIESMPDAQLAQARRLLLSLVDVQADGSARTRRRVRRAEVAPSDAADRAAFAETSRRLLEARLVVTGEHGSDEVWYDVAHEALIRRWSKLQTWLDADRGKVTAIRKVTGWAAEWLAANRKGYLLKDHRLGYAQSVREEFGLRELSTEVIDFLVASERAERRRRALVWLGVGLSIGLAIAFGVFQDREEATQRVLANEAQAATLEAHEATAAAKRSMQTAQQAVRIGQNLHRINGARMVQGREPTLALLLLRDADIKAGDPQIGWWEGAAVAVQRPVSRAVFRGHGQTINTARFSPDASSVLTTSVDGTARVWSLTGALISTLNYDGALDPDRIPDSGSDVRDANFTADGDRIVALTARGEVILWDLREDPPTATKLGIHGSRHGHEGNSIDVSPDGAWALSASEDGRAHLWPLAGGEEWSFNHQANVQTAVFSPDGQWFATASGALIRVWKLAERDQDPIVLRGHDHAVNSIAFNQVDDRTRLVSASDDKTARVWSLSPQPELEPIAVLRGHTESVRSASFDPTGERVVTGSADSNVRVWTLTGDPSGFAEFVEFTDIENVVGHVGFTTTGAHVVGVADDGMACIWDANGDEASVYMLGHINQIGALDFARINGREFVLTGSNDATARLWDTTSFEDWIAVEGHGRPIRSVAWSPAGDRVATATSAGLVHVWTQAGQGPLWEHEHSDAASISDIEFDATGDRLAAAGEDGRVTIIDVASGQLLTVLDGHDSGLSSVAWSPTDADLVLTATTTGELVLWDLGLDPGLDPGPGGALLDTPLRRITASDGRVWSGKFDPRGRTMLSASDDGRLQIWALDGSSLRSPAELNLTTTVYAAEFSPDGQYIALSTQDALVRLVSTTTGEVRELQGHVAPVLDVRFSPNSELLVTASMDGSARVWTVETGAHFSIEGHAGSVRAAAISPDSKHLLAGTSEDSAHIWHLEKFQVSEAELHAAIDQATSDCIPVELRTSFLREDPQTAQAALDSCEARREGTR